MLYFSKLRIFSVIIFSLFLSYFALSNFFKSGDIFFKRSINLGLDLQGGSYLLLEVDNNPILNQKLQSKLLELKKVFKEKNFNYKNLYFDSNKIVFNSDENFEFIKEILQNKQSEINPYYQQFKTHQLDLMQDGNMYSLQFSDYGIVLIKNASLDQAIEIVRRRVDELGTNEPNITKRGNDRILVELPGLKDPERIKSLLGKTANLSFQFVSQKAEETFGTEKLNYDDNPEREENVSKRIIISGENLIDAKPSMNNQTNETVVVFNLDRVGAKKFGKATSNNVGRQLAIILDKKIISAPTISEAIVGGSGQITGNFTFQSATDLSLLLRSGALPAPLNIIEERTVGPDLGKDSIKAGVLSLIVGFILVVLFMFYKYRLFGLIANLALITNLLLLIGILTIFQATLTLPGIAGIILTVGMAVDANVLIFERIKEEMVNEKNTILAFDAGYTKSKTTILDANVTTLIAAVILFFMGSGPIKGFSITLGIGILTTLFSVYFIARLFTAYYVVKNKEREILI
tara:strand:- start:1996 stop:3549 length:1554 start_codon:yes stop_codon:yes gene_type:complete